MTGLPPPRVLESRRGTLAMWCPKPGVFCTQATGYLEGDFGQAYCEFGDAVRATTQGKCTGIHDWELMVGYASNTRREVTSWGARVVGEFEQIHVRVHSPVLNMGVSVANAALGGLITVHTQGSSFEQVVDKKLGDGPGFHPPPSGDVAYRAFE